MENFLLNYLILSFTISVLYTFTDSYFKDILKKEHEFMPGISINPIPLRILIILIGIVIWPTWAGHDIIKHFRYNDN